MASEVVRKPLTSYAFPEEHWRRIRTKNPMERLMREIRHRTRIVGAFPNAHPCLNLAAARLCPVAETTWPSKRDLTMDLLAQRSATQQTT